MTAALALGDTLGLDEATLLEVLAESPIGPTVRAKRANIESGTYPPNVKLALALKDLRLRGNLFEEGKHQLRLTDAAVKAVTTHHYSDFLTARTQNRSPARHVETHGIFGVPDKVVCMTEFRPSVEVGEETIRVAAGGREILFDTSTKPALDLLLSGRPVGTAEVDQAAGFDVAAVVEALLTHEICAEVTPDLEAGYLDLVN